MKSVVISGSAKFIKEMHEWVKVLQKNKVQVYFPRDIQFENLQNDVLECAVAGAKYGFFQKIRKADVLLLFNVDGYAGVSSSIELGYATACAKPIVSIEEDPELARKVLIEEQVKTPEELIQYLRR